MITFYVNKNNKFLCGYTGKNWGFITFIDERFKTDKGLLEHERTHYKQFLKNPFMGLLYLFSKRKRFEFELEAYSEQLKYVEDFEKSIKLFSKYLAENYKLDISVEEAEQSIFEKYNSQ